MMASALTHTFSGCGYLQCLFPDSRCIFHCLQLILPPDCGLLLLSQSLGKQSFLLLDLLKQPWSSILAVEGICKGLDEEREREMVQPVLNHAYV